MTITNSQIHKQVLESVRKVWILLDNFEKITDVNKNCAIGQFNFRGIGQTELPFTHAMSQQKCQLKSQFTLVIVKYDDLRF